jgi:AcrR family transcriptional regulator
MRTHDGRVAADVTTDALAGHPAADVPAQPAPNVRVAPSPGPGDGPGTDANTGTRTGAGRDAGGWDCAFGPDDDAAHDSAAHDGPAHDGPAHDGPAHDSAAHDGGAARDGAAHEPARRPGRPRSERAEQAIIDATIEAIGECGIDGVRCEDVAARAGVGKATLYRRWPGKEDLLIAAFAAMRRPLPEPRGESVRDDLTALLTVVAADADDPRYAQQYALLHGAGERFPRLVARYKERVVEPRRDLVRSVLRRGVGTGELRPDIDIEVAMLMLTGAVMARGKHDSSPAAPGFVDSAVDELLRGIAAR